MKNSSPLRIWSCIGILSVAAEVRTCTVRYCTTRTSGSECHHHFRLLQPLCRRLDFRDLLGAEQFRRDGSAYRDFSKTELCLNSKFWGEGEGIRLLDRGAVLPLRQALEEEVLVRRKAGRGGVPRPLLRGDDDGDGAGLDNC